MYVLIVEDNEIVGDGIRQGLQALDHAADWVTDGATATQAIQLAQYDVVILDLTLPDEDGIDLLTKWRRRKILTPVLILTARDAVPDRISGLSRGADDYLTKPFDFEELIARLQAIIRRSMGRADNEFKYGDITYNPSEAYVKVGGMPIKLSKSEMIVLEALLRQPGQMVNTEQLQDRLYGWNDGVASNAVAVHIHNLRKKLGNNLIHTVRGVGYCFVKDDNQ
ncbi:MAG: response regulator [Methylophaga sp.]|jgi:DNA-binding response OmpR family regulator|uniref:response regulator n=1 Tax=Methylophaga sp. TaxID=2024840 RepID=UPI000C0FD25F|nr:response regulator [Methylophaga sp.]MBL1459058.1 response regulator [Methylophaga sp.]